MLRSCVGCRAVLCFFRAGFAVCIVWLTGDVDGRMAVVGVSEAGVELLEELERYQQRD